MALVMAEATQSGGIADKRRVQIPNTHAKMGDKAVLEQYQTKYVKAMMPQQVRVGVKFMVELLAMGLRILLRLRGGFIMININIINAYIEIKRAAVVGAHMRHTHFVRNTYSKQFRRTNTI